MAEYIDRQALYEAIRQLADETECNIAVLPDVAEKIREAPAADVAPVVHGQWIIRYDGPYGRRRVYCSACENHSGIGGIIKNQKKPYCPNCGAKMDLEDT